MSFDCWCDYAPPEFCTISVRKARKRYRCDECPNEILPGDRYEYVFGKWDGYLSHFRVCEGCRDIRVWTQNNVPCLCWTYGNMIEDCKVAIDDACYRAPEETQGLWFGLLRRIVLRDKRREVRA